MYDPFREIFSFVNCEYFYYPPVRFSYSTNASFIHPSNQIHLCTF